uniref:Uncharacterized protein n=1 Tax=Vitis vinifera TaxID=29760 RepID=A5BHV0_VITVI|nr:hypothetical protein VITISV_012005 [Vitis vinifera]
MAQSHPQQPLRPSNNHCRRGSLPLVAVAAFHQDLRPALETAVRPAAPTMAVRAPAEAAAPHLYSLIPSWPSST